MKRPSRWQTGLVSLLVAGCSVLPSCGPKNDDFSGITFNEPSLKPWVAKYLADGFLDSGEIEKLANIYFGEHVGRLSSGDPNEAPLEGEYSMKEVGPRKGFDYEVSIKWNEQEYRFYGKADLSEARLEKYDSSDNQ
ncbi:hypothetical protein HN499_02465 [archaeon]|jgi:hypothetical protein|nr:hypothetical protein [archaeon]